ncbi:DVUA0089 family protein [Polyangium sp. 15x6]|uniref:DVUA0089 family protein n=1 Tax=Polyangium sp. 15x6 TaxID=3042687 RepID=UPI00249CC70C|nr:DVUA0089 family protein [Polyangium sp. 15x6]MDI3290033.1 DVUA0089 family protein [Polyangium sp. 15x6]
MATFALLVAVSAGTGCEETAPPDTTGGAGGEGGTGMGGMGACRTPEDCPGADTVCRTRTCTSGVCGETFAAMGTPSDTQMPGDCAREICDGKGEITLENDDTDILDDQNDCTQDVCNAGQPENNPLPAGDTCTTNDGKFCDGAGTCVECLAHADCPDNVCANNVCVPAECADTVKNGSETDVDCGGAVCAPCADGLVCKVSSDCQSSVCDSATCQTPTCTDTVENGAETDVDCGGGTCSPCGPGLGCAEDSDCVGGSCSGSICLPTCTDQVTNRNETDVDCGGPNCSPCGTGLVCSIDSDCASKVCTDGTCQGATCGDTIQNGSETSVDCGGADCPACADGLVCNQPTDCKSGVCTGNVCQTATCTDTVKNGAETDADCGGGTCQTCDLGKGCLVNGDCTSNICAGNVCVVSLCGDGLLTGAETCDDGNAVAGDGCDAACATEVGWLCAGAPSACTAICSDGLVKGPETCDDANTASGDGCSASCQAELGYVCSGEPSACKTVCGDGIPAGTEACDDGNLNDDDACLPGCIAATCGDGFVNAAAEGCDDGNKTAGDGCNATCQAEPFFVCFGAPSTCVLVESEPNTCATATGPLMPPFAVTGKITPIGDHDYYAFTVPAVADVKIETFVPSVGTCPTGNDTKIYLLASNCTTVLVEDDDDGLNSCSVIDPTTSADAAARKLAPGTYYVHVEEYASNATIGAYQLQVTFTALCGDGILAGSEVCDDGNLTSGDGCSASCVIEQGYQCAGSPSVCALSCGDGTINGTDVCDDGNKNSGDGCSATCAIEQGYTCTGTPSVCTTSCGNGTINGTDACDDGNTVSGDGCSSVCLLEPNYKCIGTPNVCTKVEQYCNDGIDNDGDTLIDAADSDCTIPAYFPACAAGQRLVVVRAYDTPIALLDGNTTGISSYLGVANVGTVNRAAVLFNATHTWSGDIDAYLQPPGLGELDITSDNGSSGDNYTNTILDSTCSSAVSGGTAPFSGCYSPETALTPVNGKSPVGRWKLKVIDDTTSDQGTLNSWAMIFCVTP